MKAFGRTGWVGGACLAAWLLSPTPARADCVEDVSANTLAAGAFLFPNWLKAPIGSFQILECADTVCTGCTNGPMAGLTVANLGTAAAGDLTTVYYRIQCGATDTGYIAMTYAGVWNFSWGASPAWTWAGVPTWTDACTNCLCAMDLNLYADVAACPTEGDSVQFGIGFNDVTNPTWPGGFYDACGCAAPWEQVNEAAVRFIKSVAKTCDSTQAAPGDTITYTVYYGLPGTSPLTNVVVFDSQPAYTHYAIGSGVPAPDPGWDPNVGPPAQLQWTLPGGPTAGGHTAAVSFQLTVDWGNRESFEPGSGDVAAPEGTYLSNVAQAVFLGSSCATKSAVSYPGETVVQRFLFWEVADNDVLFAPAFGQPADQITYTIFVKNLSSTKTWWNVTVWDTVPAPLWSFCVGCGFYDPCSGWTMTPSGCAAASPGWYQSGPTTTVLTWKLDMPPASTLTVSWTAQVQATASQPNATSIASVLELGRSGIVNGTGNSIAPSIFTHLAPIVLQTTYVSYIGIAAANANFWGCCGQPPFATQTYWISFFPLNKRADFTLYDQEHYGDAYEANGGASPSIANYVGGCMTGGAAWIPGCTAVRAPAFYQPTAFAGCPGTTNFHNLYKLVSNCPLLWELSTGDLKNDADASTYVGTTSLTYNGYASYTYCRVCPSSPVQYTDGLYLVNTSPTTTTNAFLFQWDAINQLWTFDSTSPINSDSQWFYNPPQANSFKIISSAAPLIVYKAYPGIGIGGAYNDSGGQPPNAENGYLVSTTTPATFYGYTGPTNYNSNLVVGNVGAATATYEVWQYNSDTPFLTNPTTAHLTTQLLGNSGNWTQLARDTVPPGLANPANPHIYGAGYSNIETAVYDLYKVKLLSGGPIQVYAGRNIYSGYGCGSVIHAVTPPSGVEYWFQEGTGPSDCGGSDNAIQTIDFYVPRANVAVHCVSGNGYNATYTTPGPDSCVSFKSLTTPAGGASINYQITTSGATIAVAHQIHCQLTEKIYTAPFLNQGVHYIILTPPVAYAGQAFWITVIVQDTGGGTRTDYCGVTSFTSTDTSAQMGGTGMDAYNYTWTSNVAPCGSAPFNNGVKVFVNVVFSALGQQTIVGADITDGSITGLGSVLVVGADIKLQKRPAFSIAASGDTVQFKVCWSNYSSASGFSFTLTDAVPQGMTYLPEVPSAMDCGNTTGLAPVVSYSTVANPTPPATFTAAGPGAPPATTQWLRWTVPYAGVNSTGCGCFRVTVN